jgi:hypothetical protein
MARGLGQRASCENYSTVAEPAAAWYFYFYLYFVFALAERKNEIQKEEKVPLRKPHVGRHETRV